MSAMSAGQAGYYLGLAREDYYLQGGEPPGRWIGQGASRLGLVGEVHADHLYNLFDGLSPKGDRSLIQRQRHEGKADHRPGWDGTFSAPKSVSTLWSQADAPTRQAIQDAHARAVDAAVGYLQDEAAVTRRGKGGERQEKVGLIVAAFEHSTSRALDPQLHTHCLFMNLSVRGDGTTGTLSSLDLFLSKMAAGALYRAELAKGLQQGLGLSIQRERSWFEVEGVSRELVRSFSKRRSDIEASLKASGLRSAEAAAVAATQTRTAKEGVSRSAMFEEWRAEGRRLGWSQPQAQRIVGAKPPAFDVEAAGGEACASALERLTWDEAHFSRRDFVRYLAEECQGQGLGASEVRNAAAAFLADSPEVVKLGVHQGGERYSTRRMLQMEGELLAGARSLQGEQGHRLKAETMMQAFARDGSLSEEQLKAAWHVTVDTGGIAVVSGMAGTGKTRMLQAAREGWEAEGFRVQGAALAARAAKELTSGSGIEADTIAKTLLDVERGKSTLDHKTVLVVDEAGMIATPDMRRLIKACEAAGAKLVLVGDERQLQPIGPGAPFLELGVRHGRAELRDVRRQNEPWARQAVKDMASGDAALALVAFAERGLVTFSKTRTDSARELVAAWRSDGLRPEETLLLAGSRDEVRELNALAQDARRKAGELESFHTTVDGERMHLNDRVMFTKNKRTLGIKNGERGTVCAVSGDGERMTVVLDGGERVTIDVISFPHVTLGYATTVHKAQGATSLKAYVLGGGDMANRELAYVQTSRAKVETRIFATVQEPDDAFTKLVREMERSRQKRMASGLVREGRERAAPDR